jgi:hypothetical protein
MGYFIYKMELNQWTNEKRYSMIEDEFPDKEKFPLYYKAHKQEFIINPGQMLFIPPGWFHFVFSEDPDPETGLNFAINFWYDPSETFIDGVSGFKGPYVADSPIPKVDPGDIFRPLGILKVWRSPNKDIFYSSTLVTRCIENGSRNEFMTYDEFYETKNPEYYVLQYQNIPEIDALVPKHDTPLINSSCWLNFGNTKTLMHYDGMDNWLCQVQGRKRILLFPPEDRDLLYTFNREPHSIIRKIEESRNSYSFIKQVKTRLDQDFIKDALLVLGQAPSFLIPQDFTSVPPKKAEIMKKLYSFLEDFLKNETTMYYNEFFWTKGILVDETPIFSRRFLVFKSGNKPPEFPQQIPKITIICFLTKGDVIINNEPHKMEPGRIIIFPSSYLYNWAVSTGSSCIVST